jgi:hypothetical protein
MWGVDALLADDIVARMSAAAAAAVSAVDSSSLVQWLQTLLDHVAPVAVSWSNAFAAATNSTTTAVTSLSDLIFEVASLLPSAALDLADADHAAIFHALARAQELLHLPPERALVAVFDAATTRCFHELSRSTQVVVQRCVQTDEFSATAAPSIKHSSSAVDVSRTSSPPPPPITPPPPPHPPSGLLSCVPCRRHVAAAGPALHRNSGAGVSTRGCAAADAVLQVHHVHAPSITASVTAAII